jgi:hypothetical protein
MRRENKLGRLGVGVVHPKEKRVGGSRKEGIFFFSSIVMDGVGPLEIFYVARRTPV